MYLLSFANCIDQLRPCYFGHQGRGYAMPKVCAYPCGCEQKTEKVEEKSFMAGRRKAASTGI